MVLRMVWTIEQDVGLLIDYLVSNHIHHVEKRQTDKLSR